MIGAKVQIDPETLAKAHAVMVEILEEIDKVCKKHNLEWWIEDGTLLGAVRHKGFIPWDDDCDIGMSRADYEIFAKVAPKELKDPFFFQSKDTDPKYTKRLVKVRKKGTKLVDHDEDYNEPYEQGIYVDIFIWDYYYGWEKSLIKLFNIMPNIRSRRKSYPRGSIMRTLHGIMTAVPYAIHRTFELMYVGLRRFYRSNKNLPFTSYEAELGISCFYKNEDIYPTRRDVPFEGKYFPVPNNPDGYLSTMYGDYMQLPPPDQRHTHARKIEV